MSDMVEDGKEEALCLTLLAVDPSHLLVCRVPHLVAVPGTGVVTTGQEPSTLSATGCRLARWQGKSQVSCCPRQVTATGVLQGGQGNLEILNTGAFSSQGPTGLVLSTTSTCMLLWQLAGQMCPSPHGRSWPQICLQVGQGGGWQLCFSLTEWWQLDDTPHGFLHLGGLVCFSLPQGTTCLVFPQLQVSTTVAWQG
jgi:hypothetical protein